MLRATIVGRAAFAAPLLLSRRGTGRTLVSERCGIPGTRANRTRRPRRNPPGVLQTTVATASESKEEVRATALRVICDETVTAESNLPIDKLRKVDVAIKAEDLGGRERRISGSVVIPASYSRIWTVLTAYDKIEKYMPNIVSSKVEMRDGEIYLDQVGIISRRLMLKSRMLVRVHEEPANRTITFSRIEGRDFQRFVGKYIIEVLDNSSVQLNYEVLAVAFPLYPMSLVERKVLKEVPKMLAGIRDEAVLAKHIPFDQP